MKVAKLVATALLVLAPSVGIAGEEERNTQEFGNRPSTLPPIQNLPPDTTAAVGGLGALALIGGAAAALGSGGGNNAPIGTTATTSTTSTTSTP